MKSGTIKAKLLSNNTKIRLLDFNEIIKINEYKNILEFKEFKQLLELQNKQILKQQVKQLNKRFESSKQALILQNEELKSSLEQKHQIMIDELKNLLNNFVNNLTETINLDIVKRDYLLQGINEQCQQLGLINQDSLDRQEIKIHISFNDYCLITQTELDAKYTWLLKALKIDYSLKDGISVLESKFAKYFISYERAKEIVNNMLVELGKV